MAACGPRGLRHWAPSWNLVGHLIVLPARLRLWGGTGSLHTKNIPRRTSWSADAERDAESPSVVQRLRLVRVAPRSYFFELMLSSSPSWSFSQFLRLHQPHRRPQPCCSRAAQVCQKLHGRCRSRALTRACPPTFAVQQVSRGATSLLLHDHAQVHRAATRRRALQPLH